MKRTIALLYSIVFLSFPSLADRVVVDHADLIRPLLTGHFAPDVRLKTSFGGEISLISILEKKPSVVLFYRGGWCPYCSRQMAGLIEVEQRIIDLGYQIIAISPDSPQRLAEQKLNQAFNLTHLSDQALDATVAFGLGYYVDDQVVETIRGQLGAEVVSLEGETKVVLPVPAAYIIDTTGLIKFSYVNPNFQQRINPQLLYQAARLSR